MLPRLEILDPTRTEASLRRYRAPDGRGPTIVEKNIFESIHLTCALHQISARRTPPSSHSCRCRRGWLDFDLFSCRTSQHGNPRNTRLQVSCPVPWILPSPQVSHRSIFHLSAAARFRPHPLISSSRGSHCGHLRHSPEHRGRLPGRNPVLKPTRVYRIPGTFSRLRDGGHRLSIVVAAERSPFPEAVFGVGERRGHFIGERVGRDVRFNA
jgi:hypothetical protein